MDTTPRAQDLWEGIAGHFDSISQVLSEFIDNSASNFEASKSSIRSIIIKIDEIDNDQVRFIIEDTGSGIPSDSMESSLRLGDKEYRETPLNEHGFGIKHALASANPNNDNWSIFTRTREELEAGVFRKVTFPYSFSIDQETIKQADHTWPGEFNGSGTLIEFTTTRTLFDTIQLGIPGRAEFQRCLDYLIEELGYFYSGLIEKGKLTITITSESAGYRNSVEAIVPNWVDYYKPGSGEIKKDLGGGEIIIEYKFGEMAKKDSYIKHYQRNMSTSGAEIRINGRLLMKNLFKEIWDREKHNAYNHLLVIINLVSDDREALPITRTSKNGFRKGDEKIEGIFKWIRGAMPDPPKKLAETSLEHELVEKLLDSLTKGIPNTSKNLTTEFRVFERIESPVQVDLYVFDGSDTYLYEAKRNNADIQSVYQLIMYWDGAVDDGLEPKEGILVASSFSDGVSEIINNFNTKEDANGNNYSIRSSTWKELNVDYPPT